MDSDAVDLDKSNKRIHSSRSFTVPDNDQYKYGIASAIASAAEVKYYNSNFVHLSNCLLIYNCSRSLHL